jgi:glycosyltransferase involved in cell wall biosynthesis
MSSVSRAPHVLLVCPGLDHARRGFESFARESFDALHDAAGVHIELVKGSGPPAPGERAIPTLRRDNPLARALARTIGGRSFRLEHVTFALTLVPLLLRRRPDVVYLSEWDTARVLSAVRSVTEQRFKLLLCNGTMAGEGFEHLDQVQDLTPAAHDYVIARGADPARHTVLPLGFDIEPTFTALSRSGQSALRRQLGLPVDRRIVVSVAALNRYHKRLDRLIEEVALLPEPRPFVLLVGQPEEETPDLRVLARARLGEDGHSFRSVPAPEVPDLLRASDVFVLASLWEGLPRALIEASAHGLPCVTHSYPVTEYVLRPEGYSSDLGQPGELAAMLSRLTEDDLSPSRAADRHRYAYEKFSWDRLRPRYVELLRRVAGYSSGSDATGPTSAPGKP